MRQKKHLILGVACLIGLALCALLVLQAAAVVPPLGVGWGDGTKGRAYSAVCDGSIVLRTASGMKTPPPGKYAYRVQSLGSYDSVGIQYHHWNMTAGDQASAPVLGRFVEVRIALGWPILGLVLLIANWLVLFARQRRLARSSGCCRNCGYDLRATPDRCPECGQAAV
jgi:hypothetical protein